MVISSKIEKNLLSVIETKQQIMISLNRMGNHLYKNGVSNIVSVLDNKLYEYRKDSCQYPATEKFLKDEYKSNDKYKFGGFLGHQAIYYSDNIDKMMYCSDTLARIDKKISNENH